jgi:hypothetical protein
VNSPPSSPADAVCCSRRHGRSKFIFIYLFIYILFYLFNFYFIFLVVVAGLTREKKDSQDPQDPQAPQAPRAPRAPRAVQAKPREEEGFFGLVPLVTQSSSKFPYIPT